MWEYDPYHNSLITAGNGGTKPVQAAFTIFHNQETDIERALGEKVEDGSMGESTNNPIPK